MTLRDGSKYPYITEAKVWENRRGVKCWDLYEGELLIGWTPTDPQKAGPPPFVPSCQQYGTGRHVIVAYACDLKVS